MSHINLHMYDVIPSSLRSDKFRHFRYACLRLSNKLSILTDELCSFKSPNSKLQVLGNAVLYSFIDESAVVRLN